MQECHLLRFQRLLWNVKDQGLLSGGAQVAKSQLSVINLIIVRVMIQNKTQNCTSRAQGNAWTIDYTMAMISNMSMHSLLP